jgi:hypothetical protein
MDGACGRRPLTRATRRRVTVLRVGQWPRRPGPAHADRRASSGVCEARTALGYAQPLTPLSVPCSTQRLPIRLYRLWLRIGSYRLPSVRVVGATTPESAALGCDVLHHLIITLHGLAAVTEISQ